MGMTSYLCNSTPNCSYLLTIDEKFDIFSDDFIPDESYGDCESWSQVATPAGADAPTTTPALYDEYKDDMQYDALSIIPKNRKKIKQSERYFSQSPERQKEPQLVAKRNLRERNRVQAVNGAFNRLRRALPFQHSRGKRISKVKTLRNAINYIRGLERLLRDELLQAMSKKGYLQNKQNSMWWNLEY